MNVKVKGKHIERIILLIILSLVIFAILYYELKPQYDSITYRDVYMDCKIEEKLKSGIIVIDLKNEYSESYIPRIYVSKNVIIDFLNYDDIVEGNSIRVYHEGSMRESDPLQFSKIYNIQLIN